MKFSIAAVALLVGNGLALTQEEQAVADQQAVGVQETPENTNEANDAQAADDADHFLPHGYGSRGHGILGHGIRGHRSHGHGIIGHGIHGHRAQEHGKPAYGKPAYGKPAYGSNHGSFPGGYGGDHGSLPGSRGSERGSTPGSHASVPGSTPGSAPGSNGNDRGSTPGSRPGSTPGSTPGGTGSDRGSTPPSHGGDHEAHGPLGDYGHNGPTGCKDDVLRVKATLRALLDQVDKIRCESYPRPTHHHHKPTTRPYKPTTTYQKPTTQPSKPTITYQKPTTQPSKPTTTYKPTTRSEEPHYPTTTTRKACATPTCGKPGVKFNRYTNPFSKDFSSTYKSFDLGYFLKQKPVESGIVTDIALVSDPYNTTYANAAMEYRTFLFACQSGKYKFTSPKSDDITLMWFGDEHVKDSTRDNADILQAWYGENKPQTVYKDIKAGVYYPIRVLWGNTNGAGYLNLDIYAPNGQKLSGSNSPGKSYVVTENCQGNNPYGDTAKTASPTSPKPTTSANTQGSKPSKPTAGGSYDETKPSKPSKPSTGDSYDSEDEKPSNGGSYNEPADDGY